MSHVLASFAELTSRLSRLERRLSDDDDPSVLDLLSGPSPSELSDLHNEDLFYGNRGKVSHYHGRPLYITAALFHANVYELPQQIYGKQFLVGPMVMSIIGSVDPHDLLHPRYVFSAYRDVARCVLYNVELPAKGVSCDNHGLVRKITEAQHDHPQVGLFTNETAALLSDYVDQHCNSKFAGSDPHFAVALIYLTLIELHRELPNLSDGNLRSAYVWLAAVLLTERCLLDDPVKVTLSVFEALSAVSFGRLASLALTTPEAAAASKMLSEAPLADVDANDGQREGASECGSEGAGDEQPQKTRQHPRFLSPSVQRADELNPADAQPLLGEDALLPSVVASAPPETESVPEAVVFDSNSRSIAISDAPLGKDVPIAAHGDSVAQPLHAGEASRRPSVVSVREVGQDVAFVPQLDTLVELRNLGLDPPLPGPDTASTVSPSPREPSITSSVAYQLREPSVPKLADHNASQVMRVADSFDVWTPRRIRAWLTAAARPIKEATAAFAAAQKKQKAQKKRALAPPQRITVMVTWSHADAPEDRGVWIGTAWPLKHSRVSYTCEVDVEDRQAIRFSPAKITEFTQCDLLEETTHIFDIQKYDGPLPSNDDPRISVPAAFLVGDDTDDGGLSDSSAGVRHGVDEPAPPAPTMVPPDAAPDASLNDELLAMTSNVFPRMAGVVCRIIQDRTGSQVAYIKHLSASSTSKEYMAPRTEWPPEESQPMSQGSKVTFTPVRNAATSTRDQQRFLACGLEWVGTPDFQRGEAGGPGLAPLNRGHDFAMLDLRYPTLPLVTDAVEKQTHAARLRIAQLMQEQILTDRSPQDLRQAPLVHALIMAFHRVARAEEWATSTQQAYFQHLQSLMQEIDSYSVTPRQPPPFDWKSWSAAKRSLLKQNNLRNPFQSTPASWQDVNQAIADLRTAGHENAAVLLTIMWAHTARGENMLKLRKMDFHDNCSSIKWAEAKTTATVGQYTTKSGYGEHAASVSSHIAAGDSNTAYLFRREDLNRVRTALLQQNDGYDLRSIRRGALQTLAATGLSIAELRGFSGHTSDKSLLRYLNFGQKLPRPRSINAATALWGVENPTL